MSEAMTHDFSLRAEEPGDGDAIAAVIAAAFDLGDVDAGEAALVAGLRKAAALAVSLVAVAADGRLLGHIAFSPVTVEGQEDASLLGLAPLAVAPAAQRRGIGAALVEAGLEAARASGGDLAVVLGDPAYYGRFGFAPAQLQGLKWEHDAPPEAFMTLSLSARGAAVGPGVVRFHRAFSIFES